ncbi:MAG: glycine--tRNA ligase subunit beta, partial [Candidatus Obscuribacterales bacterium]|nr:glycine--tRNA ligase subunit beta [Candidatus Obscuribacterales bacterium]
MTTYLLEIGTEELPAAHIPEARGKLADLLSCGLKEHALAFEAITTLSTPRRLTAIVSGLPAKQPDRKDKVKGPPLERCFDAYGNPTKAALGFAGKTSIALNDLDKEEIAGKTYLVANLTINGKSTSQVLSEIVPPVINQISGERLMRWGDSNLKFARPIRWIVSLLEDQIVPFKLEAIAAGRTTFGHRILAPGEIEINSPGEYEQALKNAKVLVDPEKRKKLIEKQVKELAGSVGGIAGRLEGGLLDEVVNITEWPRALLGSFSQDYLSLPDALLETIMVHHQRYFPVDKNGGTKDGTSARSNNLHPYFITVSNNDIDKAQDTIRQGNERVLRARLADGKFFYLDDQKVKLADRTEALSQLTYQNGLGSYLDKRDRLVELAGILSRQLGLSSKLSVCLYETMALCKLDLVTNLVGELPELQGYVGGWYAELEGLPQDVSRAIASHYSPRHTDDTTPVDQVGAFAALLDKLDHITGLFCLGKRPSGS